jgi:hypothetical protein
MPKHPERNPEISAIFRFDIALDQREDDQDAPNNGLCRTPPEKGEMR